VAPNGQLRHRQLRGIGLDKHRWLHVFRQFASYSGQRCLRVLICRVDVYVVLEINKTAAANTSRLSKRSCVREFIS
jgi:hypothetical protein